ncbi:hypothetical protein D3C72_1623410 [compost metagenome]
MVRPQIQATCRRVRGGLPAGPAGAAVQVAMRTARQIPMISSGMVIARIRRFMVMNRPVMPRPNHSSSSEPLLIRLPSIAFCAMAMPLVRQSV